MRAILFVLAIVSLTLGGSAAEGCIPTTSTPAAEAGPIYVAGNARSLFCDPNCLIDIWIYEESNGIAGLQRQDELHDDTCGGQISGDSIVF